MLTPNDTDSGAAGLCYAAFLNPRCSGRLRLNKEIPEGEMGRLPQVYPDNGQYGLVLAAPTW